MLSISIGDPRISNVMKLTDGRLFNGIVSVNSVLRTQNDIADYLLQINRQAQFPVAGNVALYDNSKFILGEGVTEEIGGPIFRSLRMIRVDHEMTWGRPAPTTDTLSGLPAGSGYAGQGTAYCNMEATSKISDAFKVATSKYALVTGSKLAVNDRLDDIDLQGHPVHYTVTFVEQRHKIVYAEVR